MFIGKKPQWGQIFVLGLLLSLRLNSEQLKYIISGLLLLYRTVENEQSLK